MKSKQCTGLYLFVDTCTPDIKPSVYSPSPTEYKPTKTVLGKIRVNRGYLSIYLSICLSVYLSIYISYIIYIIYKYIFLFNFLFGHISIAYANHRGISWIVLCIAFDLVSREHFKFSGMQFLTLFSINF